MTDIFIKSFNRPFYLDRCIQSIADFVRGNYAITVLDDGTPTKYLKKLQEKYPAVIIKTSKNYAEKSGAIVENLAFGKEIDGFQIPTDLWRNAAQNASEYFVMTEDDVWFTKEINIGELAENCKTHGIHLMKLGWLGNYKDDAKLTLKTITESIDTMSPNQLFLQHPWIMDLFFYNKLKFFTIMYRLGFADHETKRNYWILNSILMGLWKKEYWLEIWKDSKGKVDEKQQLRNAANFYRKHTDNPNFVARLKHESMKTTFQSSATNSYHSYGYQFDVNYFNHLINEAWYKGEFDSMQNFPFDFSIDYFEKFLDHKVKLNEFRGWVGAFKNQYRNLGCDVGK